MTELQYNEFLKSETDLEREARIHELEHYGILGMKWGVRRTPEQLGHKTATKSKTKKSKTKKLTKEEKTKLDRKKAYKNRRTLSDEELMARIGRLEMEKRFRNLSEEDLHPGRAAVKQALSSGGLQTLRTVAAGASLYGLKVGLTGKTNVSDAADYITPKPKKK